MNAAALTFCPLHAPLIALLLWGLWHGVRAEWQQKKGQDRTAAAKAPHLLGGRSLLILLALAGIAAVIWLRAHDTRPRGPDNTNALDDLRARTPTKIKMLREQWR
jgi:hypothetical protein